ncbi:MAG: hypothetical protein WCB04_07070 [Mycobacteriales bacterium]
MRDALRGYFALANGLTEVPRRAATAAVKALFAQGEATAEQVNQLTDELLATSRSNREALANLIRYELDRTLDQMGFVTADKVRALTARVATLEAQVREGFAERHSTGPKKAPPKKAPAKKSAKKTAAKSTAARKTSAKKTSAKKTSANMAARKTSKKATSKTTPANMSAKKSTKKASTRTTANGT